MGQCVCRMVNARCLCLYRNAVLSILRLRCWDGEWRLIPRREGSPGDSRPFTVSDSLVSLELFHLNLHSFLTNKIKFILALKEALKTLYFLLVVRRVSNSFTSSSKTTTHTCGSTGDCCAISRGTWVLAPSSPNFTPEVSFSFLAPLPLSQWAEPGWIRGGECGLWPRLRWPCHWERWVGED